MDDPRNTDNAWLETEAVNYHDESGVYQHCVALGITPFNILLGRRELQGLRCTFLYFLKHEN